MGRGAYVIKNSPDNYWGRRVIDTSSHESTSQKLLGLFSGTTALPQPWCLHLTQYYSTFSRGLKTWQAQSERFRMYKGRSARSNTYESIRKSSETHWWDREWQEVQFSTTCCCSNAIFWASLRRFSVIILCVPSQQVFVVLRVTYSLWVSGDQFEGT